MSEAADVVLGGVLDLALSCALFAAVVAWSGEVACGFSWGIVLSKSSARSSFEKVRFASSAVYVSGCVRHDTKQGGLIAYSSGNEAPHGECASSAEVASPGIHPHVED